MACGLRPRRHPRRRPNATCCRNGPPTVARVEDHTFICADTEAEAAELAPGTLYLYFESKTALYVELLMEGYDELLRRLHTELAQDGTPLRQAERLIETFFAFARDCPEYFGVIFFVLQMEVGGTRQGALPPAQVKRLQQKEGACKDMAAGILGPDAAPADVTMIDAVWSMLVGTIFYFRGAGEEKLEAVEAQAKRLVLRAVFGAEAG